MQRLDITLCVCVCVCAGGCRDVWKSGTGCTGGEGVLPQPFTWPKPTLVTDGCTRACGDVLCRGLLYELTSDGDSRGAEFENCQLRSYTLKVPLEAGSSSDGEGQSSAQVPVLRERMPNLLSALFR